MTVPDPRHFDRDAARYDSARPGYPDAVFARLRDWGAFPEGARVLELGPGTGQATRQLLAHGAGEIVAVELGPGLAALLRERTPDDRVRVVVGDANTIPLEAEAFDLVVAATSFHWLDAERVLPRLAAALRSGGSLAVLWNVFGHPQVTTAFRSGLDALIGQRRPSPPWQVRTDERVAELTRGGAFTNARHEIWRWSSTLSTADVTDLFSTFSDLADRPGLIDDIGALVDRLGGRIEDHWLTALYCVQRA